MLRPIVQGEPQVARVGLGQKQRRGSAAAFGDAPHGAPPPAVVRELHVVARCVLARRPAQDETAEFARPTEIDREPLLAARRRIAPPCGRGLAIDGARGLPASPRGGCAHVRSRPGGRHRRQLLQHDVAHVDGAAAAAAPGRHDELDRRRAAKRTVLRGPPRELDLPLLDRDLLPFARKCEVRPVVPPDVVAACIDELDLQVVHRCVGPQPERDGVVLRQVERQGAARNRVARGAAEIEVQPQRRPPGIDDGMQRRRHAVGRNGIPRRDVVEAIEDPGRGLRRIRARRSRPSEMRRRIPVLAVDARCRSATRGFHVAIIP